MGEPRVPGDQGERLQLSCGETVVVDRFDLGMREFDCDCGGVHAVVLDVHPMSRFVPESLVEVLRASVEPDDEFEEFTTAHLLGMVVQEFPERTVSEDVSENGQVGAGLLWVTDFDSRRLHEVVVELLVELMDHAMSHAGDDDAVSAFESQMRQFDVAAFVEEYRRERNFETEHDSAV